MQGLVHSVQSASLPNLLEKTSGGIALKVANPIHFVPNLHEANTFFKSCIFPVEALFSCTDIEHTTPRKTHSSLSVHTIHYLCVIQPPP